MRRIDWHFQRSPAVSSMRRLRPHMRLWSVIEGTCWKQANGNSHRDNLKADSFMCRNISWVIDCPIWTKYQHLTEHAASLPVKDAADNEQFASYFRQFGRLLEEVGHYCPFSVLWKRHAGSDGDHEKQRESLTVYLEVVVTICFGIWKVLMLQFSEANAFMLLLVFCIHVTKTSAFTCCLWLHESKWAFSSRVAHFHDF